MRKLIPISLLVLLLSACGSLRVKVDVINPDYLEQQAQQPILHSGLNVVLSQPEDFVSETLAHQSRDHEKYYRGLAEQYRQEASKLNDSKKINTLNGLATSLESAAPDAKAIYANYAKKIIAINKRIQEAVVQLPEKARALTIDRTQPIRGGLAFLLRERKSELRSLSDFIYSETGSTGNLVGNLTGERLSVAKSIVMQFKANSNLNYRDLTGGLDLTDDPVAHAVAAAPPEFWAPRFNEAVAKGYLGNVDIAIKMNKPGDFTIKGLLFDPSTVASVASKTVTQALLIAAQISGVPVSSPSPSGDGTALATSSTNLAQAQAAVAERKAAQNSSRAALIEIADAIVREKDNVADDAKRQAALEAIRTTFDKHQSRINPSASTK